MPIDRAHAAQDVGDAARAMYLPRNRKSLFKVLERLGVLPLGLVHPGNIVQNGSLKFMCGCPGANRKALAIVGNRLWFLTKKIVAPANMGNGFQRATPVGCLPQ